MDLSNPHRAAQFFAFLEYPRGQIADFLTQRCGVDEEEAERLTVEAQDAHGQRKQADDQTAERAQRAVAAEHDMTRTNWR